MRYVISACLLFFIGAGIYRVVQQPIAQHPLIDDSFYAFSIARNIASGKGITYGDELTNGFQPLFVFASAAIFKISGLVSDDQQTLPIRAILACQALIGFTTAYLIGVFVLLRTGNRLASTVAACIWLVSPTVLLRTQNGLETSLATLMMASSVVVYFRMVQRKGGISYKGALGLGVVLGLGVLTRIDFVLFSTAIAVTHFLRSRTHGREIGKLMAMAATTFIVSMPWFLYNYKNFGHPLPTSAHATGASGEVRQIAIPVLDRLFSALQTIFWAPPFGASGPAFRKLEMRGIFTAELTAILGLATAVLLIGLLAYFGFKRDATLFALSGLFYIAAYTSRSVAIWFFNRYMFPLSLLMTLAFGLLLAHFARRLTTRVQPRVAVAVLTAYLISGAASIAYHSFVYSRSATDDTFTKYQTAEYLKANAPGGKIGAFQSGVLEYFLGDWVVNCDGKVSQGALAAIEGGSLDRYLQKREVQYLIDWKSYTASFFENYPACQGDLIATIGPDEIYFLDCLQSSSSLTHHRSENTS